MQSVILGLQAPSMICAIHIYVYGIGLSVSLTDDLLCYGSGWSLVKKKKKKGGGWDGWEGGREGVGGIDTYVHQHAWNERERESAQTHMNTYMYACSE